MGYAQQYSMDYDKTTALTAHLELFCLILHIAASLRWDLHQFDIKTPISLWNLACWWSCLHGTAADFQETGKEDWVMQFLKSIYLWHEASKLNLEQNLP